MKHKDYYIHLLMETLSEKEYKDECQRLKYILGAHPKPKRSDKAQQFVDFVQKNIYSGNTGVDLLKKHFKVKTDNQTVEYWINKTGLTKEVLQKKVDASSRLARIIINKLFIKYDEQLSLILKD